MKRLALTIVCAATIAGLTAQTPANPTLTAVPGIKVGHFTLTERPTGCTVILVDGDAVGGVSQRGGAHLSPEGHRGTGAQPMVKCGAGLPYKCGRRTGHQSE